MFNLTCYKGLKQLLFVSVCVLLSVLPTTAQNEVKGKVWFDQNSDGIIDLSESSLSNVPVYLLSCSGQYLYAVLTANDGTYTFTNIPNGIYKVFFNKSLLPSNYIFTRLTPSTNNQAQNSGYSACFDIQNNGAIINGGLTVLPGVGDLVWDDLNGNGIQDSGENGIPNVNISLYNTSNILIAQTSSNSLGYYNFKNVFPGNYYIKFNVLNVYLPTSINNNPITNSDVTAQNGLNTTSTFIVIAGTNRLDIDGGFYKCAKICGIIYNDSNFSDSLSTNENGINGILVNLVKINSSDTTIFSSTFTELQPGSPSDDGYYEFCVPPGKYYIQVVPNPNTDWIAGLPFIGSNARVYNHITHVNGLNTTYNIDLSSGDQMCNINNGFYCGSDIGNRVWLDNNGDGDQDSGEPGLANILVTLHNCNNNVLSNTITDSNGNFAFQKLRRGTYYIKCNGGPGYSFTVPFAQFGNIPNADSNVTGENGNGSTPCFFVNNCDKITNIDIGLLSAPLPVSWKDVSVVKNGNNNTIQWEVSTEINLAEYQVFRKYKDQTDFTFIGKVLPNNSLLEKTYAFIDDASTNQSLTYYQIRSLDYDGKISRSKVVSINRSNGNFTLSITPNPATDIINIGIIGEFSNSPTSLSIVSKDGKKVYFLANVTQSELTIDTSEYASGMYILTLYEGDKVLESKPLIIK